MRAVSGQLGRDLVQSELDLFHYARVCARCGGGGANQVARVAKKFRVQGSVRGSGCSNVRVLGVDLGYCRVGQGGRGSKGLG